MRFLGIVITLVSLPLCFAQTAKVEVLAETYFNPTGFQVQSGKKYQLTATGIWTDWYIDSDADGYPSTWSLQPFERFRRSPAQDWFRLICCVNESEDNCMSIGTKATITPAASGQLFCYANDVPNMYWNNKGKLDLQISAL